MGIGSIAEYVNSFEAGQFCETGFLKLRHYFGVGAVTAANEWVDMVTMPPFGGAYSYAPGQAIPLYETTFTSIWHGGNVSPLIKKLSQITLIPAATIGTGHLVLCDYLLCYCGIQVGQQQLQTMDNTVTLPRYTNGVGVMMFMVITSPVSSDASSTVTINVTDCDGLVRDLFATISTTNHPYNINPTMSAWPFIVDIGAPFRGIKQVNSVRITTAGHNYYGEVALVLCRPIWTISIREDYTAIERDSVQLVPSLPRIYDGAHLNFLLYVSSALTGQIQGYIKTVWG